MSSLTGQETFQHKVRQNVCDRGGEGKRGFFWLSPDICLPPCASVADNKRFQKRYLPQTHGHQYHCTFALCRSSCNQLKTRMKFNNILYHSTKATTSALHLYDTTLIQTHVLNRLVLNKSIRRRQFFLFSTDRCPNTSRYKILAV